MAFGSFSLIFIIWSWDCDDFKRYMTEFDGKICSKMCYVATISHLPEMIFFDDGIDIFTMVKTK